MSNSRAQGVPSIGWLLLMSAWMLSTAIPGAVLGWLGFVIIGIIGKMKHWVIVGVVLGAAALLVALPIWGQWQSMASAIVYLGGMLLALAANPSWLRTMWERSQGTTDSAEPVMARTNASSRQATTRQPSTTRSQRRKTQQKKTPQPKPQPRPQPAASAAAAPAADSESAKLAERAGASTAAYFAAPAQKAEPIDVNEADARALAELPGLSRASARQLVRQRDKQGGFTSLEAFATAAALQPHQLVRLREMAICSPPARGRRQFGRRVDY